VTQNTGFRLLTSLANPMGLRTIGVIPAHLESQRLPRKPLRMICGRPMLAWVYEHALEAKCLDGLLVATDSSEILDFCRRSHMVARMTSAEHRSGTDRLVEVMQAEPADIYVNIQGDEPMVTAQHIELLLQPFRAPHSNVIPAQAGIQVSTLKVAITSAEALNPNNVKVVTDCDGHALYFSRAIIPHDRDRSGSVKYYKHLGLYAYTAAALEKFHSLPPSRLEQTEKLEQLRFLENGVPIVVLETKEDTIGVDTEEDLKKVEAYFAHTVDKHSRPKNSSR